MNLNRLTEKAQEAVLGAQQSAERSGHPELLPEHLALALVTQPDDGCGPTLVTDIPMRWIRQAGLFIFLHTQVRADPF